MTILPNFPQQLCVLCRLCRFIFSFFSFFFKEMRRNEKIQYKRKSNANHESARIPKNPIQTKTNEHRLSHQVFYLIRQFRCDHSNSMTHTYHGHPGNRPNSNGKCNSFILKNLIRMIHFNRICRSHCPLSAQLN